MKAIYPSDETVEVQLVKIEGYLEEEKLYANEPAGKALWVAYGRWIIIKELGVVIFHQFTGVNVVLFYSVEIFINQGAFFAKVGTTLVGIATCLMAVITIFIVESKRVIYIYTARAWKNYNFCGWVNMRFSVFVHIRVGI